MLNLNNIWNIGKRRRLSRIFNSEGRCLIVPLDDNLISGSITGISNIKNKIQQIECSKPNAILAYQGTLGLVNDYSIPLILNLTASTINATHTHKVLVSSIEKAISLGADAVAVHINISSKYESDMLKTLGKISEECDQVGIPLLAIAYPRGEYMEPNGIEIDQNYSRIKVSDQRSYGNLVSHCVRVAFELGADIIKTQYTGSIDTFKKVVESAVDKPVVIAGGDKIDVFQLFIMVEDAMKAGASGVSIGRNVFNREDSDKIICCLKKLIFENISATDSLELYNNRRFS
ncbi:2-amino-3,7-dideoxy-D-threo-hept-6-ulosonate synthase [Porcipelethomonas ammoniilytica]|uniref:2-amino-3,7-dideoxy-D-threo-hept-6-ulosonate synthase n=1 Tax=Porcipelethomonas ammoniilytica TaxID=2981722 RepID=UPI000821707C|nr:2-amino-3,7-dideoxy-D-threo-hept-6-ulosonate synthase [Porcipelethomonas ammoniilytica]MCU6720426.1 2-amino-3,7-dideoxy-D-threo-hept-6-ulosonate synthase [Porcipelethomonas ammoniilytica]SCJ12531.1 2-amino-4%2C5-dihydroxy-6-one-heptanoic acid-7-phosphate synthase [uncultured Ruminococcus sp.]